MYLREQTLILHEEDFKVSAAGRNRVIIAIRNQMTTSDTPYISLILVPHKYEQHFLATDLYKDMRSMLFSEVEIGCSDYDF